MTTFQEFPKIPRGTSNELITITEKLNGTNACILVDIDAAGLCVVTGVQSRKRIITPQNDNYGFANWVERAGIELAERLGKGYHYGEWYGLGIQKNPHNKDTKRLALFNSERWQDGRQTRPEDVECVPILFEGEYDNLVIDITMENLLINSKNQGYKAEGVVVWYHKTRRYEKFTYEYQKGKWGQK